MKGKKWATERLEDDTNFYDNLVKPNISDTNIIAKSVFNCIYQIMMAEEKGIFPSITEAKEIIAEDVYQRRSPPTWNNTAYLGEQMFIDVEEGESGEEVCMYDLPMRLDLNKKDTVKEVMKYSAAIRKYIIACDPTTSTDLNGFTPILETMRIAMAGDGSPINAAQNILREIQVENEEEDEEEQEQEESEEEKDFRTVLPAFGGFHLMLEIFKKRGSLFDVTHLRSITSMYRESKKAVDYVLNPSDPNQANREMMCYHLAVYLSAIQGLRDEKFGNDEDLQNVTISPADVIDFMISRAKESPQAFVILVEKRYFWMIIG